MPTLEPVGSSGIVTVTGFSATGYRIGESRFPDGLLVWPEAADAWMPPPLAEAGAAAFAVLADIKPPIELILLGTGTALRRPPRPLVEALAGWGMAVEPMDSRAAARTYNLLAGEGRRVAAALYPLTSA